MCFPATKHHFMAQSSNYVLCAARQKLWKFGNSSSKEKFSLFKF